MFAVVPVKNLDQAKTRLAGCLSPVRRRGLYLAMLEDVLRALAATPKLSGVVVVTRDAAAAELATGLGARILTEEQNQGQSRAVELAARTLANEGAQGILAIPGDVPLVTPEELSQVLAAHGDAPSMTIVPAADERGSNCLVCSPPDLISFHFGNDSFQPHLAGARERGVEPRILRLPGLGLDIDGPGDLARFHELGAGGKAVAYLDGRLSRAGARDLARMDDERPLMEEAAALRDQGHGAIIGYSRKVFIPLTRLCRNACAYCTFADQSCVEGRAYLSLDEVLDIARQGRAAGCTEALFTLGDKPELRHPEAARELDRMGHETTLSYLRQTAERVLEETGLLPHINAGVMGEDDLASLRRVSVSQGLMLESAADRLCGPGQPHNGCPDKRPEARLETIERAGRLSIPFTSGILIGIGETRAERIDSLLALRDLHDRYGHLQEIIIQNFRAKPTIPMARHPEPGIRDLQWTIATTRMIFGPDMTIQAPPNLSTGELGGIMAAGINDWGGVSPLTPDHVNPEAPWPEIDELARETARHGLELVERLALHPPFATDGAKWLDGELAPSVWRAMDGHGFARGHDWCPGLTVAPPPLPQVTMNSGLEKILARAVGEKGLDQGDILRLFQARGPELADICAAADELRQKVNGETITYVVNRNINYTNICTYKCGFCAFSKGKTQEALRGAPYDLIAHEIAHRVRQAWERGASEVCLQGGIHPDYTGEKYLELCRTVRQAAPQMHIHAFSPLEIWHGAHSLDLPLKEFLARLRDAGLGSLPGTAAEILDDEVRARLCPDKINTDQWFQVIGAAHAIGLPSTATIMFGHLEKPIHWARHLIRLRHQQEISKGFTEMVMLPFTPMESPVYLKGKARRGPTFREAVLMHAVARLALHPLITNIQASWVKMGPAGAAACLEAGANDLGGTLMDESISRAAGSAHGQELSIPEMEAIIRDCGRLPAQRGTLYQMQGREALSA